MVHVIYVINFKDYTRNQVFAKKLKIVLKALTGKQINV
jgi:hypothetical protein